MSVETSVTRSGRNPLQALPSILALRDLRETLRLPRGDAATTAARLLSIDPLTLLRCLRIAYCPLHAAAAAGVGKGEISVRELCSYLGVTAVRRAFERDPVEPADTGDVRQLWLHALATATAARELATMTGVSDPDIAWIRGLLCDLESWLRVLRDHGGEACGDWTVGAWVEQWNLPAWLGQRHTWTPDEVTDDPVEALRTDPSRLIPTASLLADASDFRHPGDDAMAVREMSRERLTRESLVLSQNVRHAVQDLLAELGLSHVVGLSMPQSAIVADPSAEIRPVFGMRGRSTGSQIELVNSLLACNRAKSYRAVLTAGTASALRFLDFDRATVVRWERTGMRCWVRAKHDLTRVSTTQLSLDLNEREAADFATALKLEQPVHLVRHAEDGDGLMSAIGSDTALATPLNRIFEVPTFLVLDRTLTARPIELHRDVNATAALSGVFTLLTDNLLLRLQRIRAQRSAISDPLTRLQNRTVGMLALEREFEGARRSGRPMSVMMIDLDDFKKLNDTHGHMVGDQALQLTAQVLRRTVRKADVVCRYGGEEFLAVLPGANSEDAAILATRLYLAIEEAGVQYGLPVTASIGAASLGAGDESPQDLLFRADRALYASKSSGRNRFSVDDE